MVNEKEIYKIVKKIVVFSLRCTILQYNKGDIMIERHSIESIREEIKDITNVEQRVEEIRQNIINRIEIIDENGRAYVKYNIEKLDFSLHDDNHTLKVFVNK